MAGEDFNFLRSTPEDQDFHTSRLMFWIKDGEIVVAPSGTSMSHLEMAELDKWVDGTNNQDFFNRNPRGFYLKDGNRVHFYRGIGFGFTPELEEEIIASLPQIRTRLNLDPSTEVYFGPKDSPIKGIEYPIKRAGTIKDLTRDH